MVQLRRHALCLVARCNEANLTNTHRKEHAMKISKLDADLVKDALLPKSCKLSWCSIDAIMDSYDAKAQARGEESEEFNAEFFEGWDDYWSPSRAFRKTFGYTKTRKEEARIAAELEAEGEKLEDEYGDYTNEAEEKFFEALKSQDGLEVLRANRVSILVRKMKK